MDDLTQEELDGFKLKWAGWKGELAETIHRIIAEVERRRAGMSKSLVGASVEPEWVVYEDQSLLMRHIVRPLEGDRLHVLRCSKCREAAILQHKQGCEK